MTYDYELILIGETYIENDIGDMVPVETEKTVLCSVKSVARNEFYSAAMAGLKPEIVFVVHNYEYGGEKKAIYEGHTFRVIRTYATDFEEIELACERVIQSANT